MANANYVLIQETTLNANASSVTFSGIPQTGYTDLKVVVSARGDAASAYNDCYVQFNSNASNYSTRSINGDGSSATSNSNSGAANSLRSFFIPGANATSNTFGNSEIYIPNYTSANYKSTSMDGVTENNGGAYMTLRAGLWSDVSAITSVTIIGLSTNFVAGSSFSLYGIAALGTTPAIAPKADGGNVIATDGTYWYHAFLSSGTFTPQVSLSADMLVIAGGGGGGGDVGGGGGAGRLYALTSQSMSSATNYVCTVGAGGATNNPAINAPGLKGTDSSLIGGALSYTSLGGGGGNGRAAQTTAPNNGWNGGGGSYDSSRGPTAGLGGNPGGATTGAGSDNCQAGGGGGAGAAGSTVGGAGVNTYSSWATATSTGVSGYYAGGGGGAYYNNNSTNAAGGAGGGGYGGNSLGAPSSGTANTGSGGGGSGSTTTIPGGLGGSGIIIIRYPIAS